MTKKTKLELTWIGKENLPKLEPRILLEDREKSCIAPHRVTDHDLFDNRLIFGDNLLALKALEQEFSGKVQSVYIDPPFNTQQAFEHYDDSIEHSLWLSLMRDRFELLRALLNTSGSLWLHLDDNEAHRARCILDEVFGAENFIGTVIWEKSDSPRMDAEFFSSRHDYIIVYGKDKNQTKFRKLILGDDELPDHYDKVDDSGRKYYLKPLRAMGGQGDSRATRPTLYYGLRAPDGTQVFPKRQDGTDGAWRWRKEKTEEETDRIDWVQGRNGWTPYYRIYADKAGNRPPETLWPHIDVGSNRTSKAEIKAIFPDSIPFGTPKPERLLERVIHISSEPGDWVLDSFAGSGTTGAVAHKMGRRWIMVELGEHCHSHIIPRLKKVINGAEKGGITEAVDWKGGGGFRYYHLAPSLLEKDKWGNWVINKAYNPAMLAQAVCKLEGFTYAPSDTVYWEQGHSTGRDFIYVTTQNLSHDQLQALSDEVSESRSLLVMCAAFRGKSDRYSNLTIKKIPTTVLSRCEWDHDDYSLKVENLPKAPVPPGQRLAHHVSRGARRPEILP